MHSILFVCTGNICRSPTAEGLARAIAAQRGLDMRFDSAGTHDYHVGEPPDPRSCRIAREMGTPIDDLRARQVERADFERFDLILAADRGHLAHLQRLRPANARARLELQLPWCGEHGCADVPDPYYGSLDGFRDVYALLKRATDGLLLRVANPA